MVCPNCKRNGFGYIGKKKKIYVCRNCGTETPVKTKKERGDK